MAVAPGSGASAGDVLPERLSLDVAVRWALRDNPELAALRQQHGVAAGGVVISRTYPFNPAWEQRVTADNGPTSAGITNRVAVGTLGLQELEVRGQGRYRRQQAAATLSRTDWDIATQEAALAVRTTRAFYTVLYRQEKLRVIQEGIALNEQAANQLQEAVNLGAAKYRPDLIVMRTEIDALRATLSPGQAALQAARYELYRSLGVVATPVELVGGLEIAPPHPDPAAVLEAAQALRPELHSRQAAVAEARAALRLEVANRFGNPTLGPDFELNETSVYFIGGQFTLPLPVWNTHRGEILQRQAEARRAALELRQTQVAVEQDVQAALARLAVARRSIEVYRDTVLPYLRESLDALQRLFAQGDPNVDVLRVLDVRRKLITAQDGYLDALWELTQAWADLVAAIGDPALLLETCAPSAAAPAAAAPASPQARLLDVRPPEGPDVLSLPAIQLRPCSAEGGSPP
jgi:cobalt-zinc-cadmium efflux system outer membrane protein